MDVGVAHDRAELFEGNFAVLVLVGEHNGLVDDLLQLGVFQVVAHHHFQHLKQLPVRDEPVVVHVVYSERKFELGQLVALDTELGHALDKLLEVDLAVAVRVEDVYDALDERVLLQLRKRHELVDAERARVVQIELLEALAQTSDLVGVEV